MNKIIEFPLQPKTPESRPADGLATLECLVREMIDRRQGSAADVAHMLSWSQRIWSKYHHQIEHRAAIPLGLPRESLDKLLRPLERHYAQLMLRLLVELMHAEYARLLAERRGRP